MCFSVFTLLKSDLNLQQEEPKWIVTDPNTVTNIHVGNHSVVDCINPQVPLQSFNGCYITWALQKGIFFMHEEKSIQALL